MSFLAVCVLVALVLLGIKTLNLTRTGAPRPRRTRYDTSAWGQRPAEPPAEPGDDE